MIRSLVSVIFFINRRDMIVLERVHRRFTRMLAGLEDFMVWIEIAFPGKKEAEG